MFDQGRPDPRVAGYAAAVAAGLLAALVIGRAEFAALAAPFATVLAIGLSNRRRPLRRASVRLDAERCLEGDEVHGTVLVEIDGPADVDIVVSPLPGCRAVDPAPMVGWSLSGVDGLVSLPFTIAARTWGRHELDTLEVRARRPFGLVAWDARLSRGPTLRVLPAPARLDLLLRPSEPRGVAGIHPSRVRGEGADFRELRAYRPGDRVRDIAWAASARADEPWVRVHNAERTGTLVLLIDTDFDRSAPGVEALTRTARAAWAVAQLHLKAQDRVGVLGIGTTPLWLGPATGRRARWALLDALLTVGHVASGGFDGRGDRPVPSGAEVPADALIVGISDLRSRAHLDALLHHERSGRTTVALEIRSEVPLPPTADPLDLAARRLWEAELESSRRHLDRAGIAWAAVLPGQDLATAVRVLQLASRRRARRARA